MAQYQLDHLHVTDPALRRDTVAAAEHPLWVRSGVNAVVGVGYAFLVRALSGGTRWAYRRVITIVAPGIVGPTSVVEAHFATGLPGRDIRRFRTS